MLRGCTAPVEVVAAEAVNSAVLVVDVPCLSPCSPIGLGEGPCHIAVVGVGNIDLAVDMQCLGSRLRAAVVAKVVAQMDNAAPEIDIRCQDGP